ncbi:MAG: hypothetical protein M3486_09130 [Actinomycetota bacterium]|nr:hypothetical protein [Actinomycetota bacterium]
MLLRREARLLVDRLRLWTPARFAASAPSWGSRGDLVHHLAQDLVDRTARSEGAPARRLPRLDSDLALPDQLAVSADDLVRAGLSDDDAVPAAAHLLAHRAELLEDEIPPGLAAALGLDDVLLAGQRACDGTAECRTPM